MLVGSALSQDVSTDVGVIARSGLFDADFYAGANADVLADGEDPLEHFCRIGWHELRNPRPDFDLWWYWVEHLDPTRDLVNPLVHFVQEGRRAGLATEPEIRVAAPAHPEPPLRRVCLVAGHDRDGCVDDTLVTYVRELSRFADVYFLADNELDPSELAKLDPHVRGAWGIEHGAYDFGSWSRLAKDLVGWDVVASYDELLLVNDSCYLLRDLDDVFATMDSRACDWWGLQATLRHFSAADREERHGPVPLAEVVSATRHVPPRYDDHVHVGSYFLAFRATVIQDAGFRRRLDSVVRQEHKRDLVRRYETGLCRYLLGRGFGLRTYVEDVHPFHPVYSATAWQLVSEGFPLLKRQLLASNPLGTPDLADWKERLGVLAPTSPVEAMERHLLRTADPAARHRGMSIVTAGRGCRVSTPWQMDALRREDSLTPTFDHWWAFPAPLDGQLSGDAWAILGATLDDPTLRTVVLTSSRHLDVAGANTVVLPLASREGQWHLMRSGLVLSSAPDTSAQSLGLEPALHQVVWPDPRADALPRLDLLTCPPDELPGQLLEEERRLAERLRGRGLLLWLLPEEPTDGRAAPPDAADLARLGALCRERGLVVGVRGRTSAAERDARLVLGGSVEAVDVGTRSFPTEEVLLRAVLGCAHTVSNLMESLDEDGSQSSRPRTRHAESMVRHLRRRLVRTGGPRQRASTLAGGPPY